MQKYMYWVIVVLLFTLSLNAQHLQNATWYFGEDAGLDFLPDPNNPTIISGSDMTGNEGCATVSDQNGELIFYTNGITVWNKFHNVVLNGDGLYGHSSSTQGVIIVPKPFHNNHYYIVTIDGSTGQISTVGQKKGLFYSEIDMTDPNGEVILSTKNTALKDHNATLINQSYLNTSEKLTSTVHANGKEYWVVTQIGGFVYSYLVTSSGIGNGGSPNSFSSAPIQLTGTGTAASLNAGQMKISQKSDRIAIAYLSYYASDGAIAIGNFNNSNGEVTFTSSITGHTQYYGIEFSPNSQYLYFNANIPTAGHLYVANAYGTPNPQLVQIQHYKGSFQLAINDKIYISNPNAFGNNKISVIHDPNNAASPNAQHHSIELINGTPQYGLPQWVHWHTEYCLPYTTLTMPDLNFTLYIHKYSEYIITNTNFSVNSNQDITLQAGDYVLMEPNTYIQSGSKFLATIAPCVISGVNSSSARPGSESKDISNGLQGILLYPNPASDNITISINESELSTITVYSVEGKQMLVYTAPDKTNSAILDVASLQSGIYLVAIDTAKGEVITEKLIIK